MHGLVARLIAERKLHGLRLDHIDGLRDPAQYTRRLQELIRRIQLSRGKQPFYLLIEKILGDNEPLPNLSGVAGTTGYERLNHISHVLLEPERAASRSIRPGAISPGNAATFRTFSPMPSAMSSRPCWRANFPS